MRILVLIQCANLGGMEQSTLLLMEELQKMGHAVELISLHSLGAMASLLSQRDIPARGVGYSGKWGWRSFFRLRSALKSTKADALIMVGHNLMASLAIGKLCRDQRIMCLHFHHEGVIPGWAWDIVYRISVSRFDKLVYPSRFIMEEAGRVVPRLKNKINSRSYLIPSPIALPPPNDAAQKSASRKKLGLAESDKVIGNAGWLIPRKRWDVYLLIAARVASVIPSARFLIAGDGPEKRALEQLAVALGVSHKVNWLGWSKDLTDFYRSLDVMVFNSDWDAMGRAPLEAMSYGVPVVASVVQGGLKEILDSPRYGMLLDTHNTQELSERVIQFLRDAQIAEVAGLLGRKRIEEVGSPRIHAERVLELLGKGKQLAK